MKPELSELTAALLIRTKEEIKNKKEVDESGKGNGTERS